LLIWLLSILVAGLPTFGEVPPALALNEVLVSPDSCPHHLLQLLVGQLEVDRQGHTLIVRRLDRHSVLA
jgi:hypothetical protein